MAQYLSKQGRSHVAASVVWTGLGEGASCFPEFSCSHCITSTSSLVFLPILPACPISIYLKYDWRLQIILLYHTMWNMWVYFLKILRVLPSCLYDGQSLLILHLIFHFILLLLFFFIFMIMIQLQHFSLPISLSKSLLLCSTCYKEKEKDFFFVESWRLFYWKRI